MSGKYELFLSVGGALALAASAVPAVSWADEQPVTLTEIVVTAQKRSEKLQDVPLAITALSGDELAQIGAYDFSDYARRVPGLSFDAAGPTSTKVVLRGISTGLPDENRPAVGYYLDDVPLASSPLQLGTDLQLVDVDRVEVLRGPQGTLYGAGSMGGTIKIVTHAPDLDSFYGQAMAEDSGTHGGGNNYNATMTLNLPLVADRVAVRVSGFDRHDDGFIDQLGTGIRHVNDDKISGGRLALRVAVTPDLGFTLTGLYQHSEFGGWPAYDASAITLQPITDTATQTRYVREPQTTTYRILNAVVKYSPQWADVTSSTSYFDNNKTTISDLSAFGRVALSRALPPPALATLTVVSASQYAEKSFSQEIHVASKPAGPFHWIAGVFYQSDRFTQAQEIPANVPAFNLVLNELTANTQYKREDTAVFGEGAYDLTEELSATAGLRYARYKETDEVTQSGATVGPGLGQDSKSSDASVTTPRFVLSYKPVRGALYYASASEGFREGGTNFGVPPDLVTGAPAPASYGSDTLWNYELGAKNSWLGGRASTNLAVFYIDWQSIQSKVIRDDGFSYYINAGSARSRGFELEASWLATDHLTLSTADAYTDSTFRNDVVALGAHAGDPVAGVPSWQASAAMEYRHHLTGPLDGLLRADWTYTGQSHDVYQNSGAIVAGANTLQGNYDLLNLVAGIQTRRWEFDAFATNALNEHARLSVGLSVPALPDTIVTNRPRTIGVRFRTSF